jgi:hypothetical protein
MSLTGHGRCLFESAFAGPADILWTAGDNHTELGRDDIQPLTHVLANHVLLAATNANRALWRNHHFNAWQVFGQAVIAEPTVFRNLDTLSTPLNGAWKLCCNGNLWMAFLNKCNMQGFDNSVKRVPF